MQISTAEKNTMASLISEVVTAESILTQTQNLVSEAITRRDAAQKNLDRFLQSIPVSDAPAEVKPKRAYIRRSRTGVKPDHVEGCTCPICDATPNAAHLGEQSTLLGDKHQ